MYARRENRKKFSVFSESVARAGGEEKRRKFCLPVDRGFSPENREASLKLQETTRAGPIRLRRVNENALEKFFGKYSVIYPGKRVRGGREICNRVR